MRQPSNIPSVNLCIIRLPTTAYSVRQVSDASHRICRTPMIAHSKQQPSHIPDSDRRVFQMPTITYSGRQTSLAPSVDHCTVQVPTIAYSVINHRVPCLHNCLHTSPLVFSFFFFIIIVSQISFALCLAYRFLVLVALDLVLSCLPLAFSCCLLSRLFAILPAACPRCARSRVVLLAACLLVSPSLSPLALSPAACLLSWLPACSLVSRSGLDDVARSRHPCLQVGGQCDS